MPPGSSAASAASPRTSCIEARFFELASVKNSVPCANSNDARIIFGPMPGFFPGSRQRRRPAIIRWMTRNRSSAKREHDALADAAHVADGLAVERFDRRIDGPENEGAEEAESLEAPADDVAGQRLDVDDDVGQFRQSLSAATRRSARASTDDRRSGAG